MGVPIGGIRRLRPLRLFRPAQTPRPQGLALALLVAYVSVAGIAYAWTTSIGGLAVLWPCNGILAASLLLLPRSQGLVVALISGLTDFVFAWLSGTPIPQAALIATCDLTEAFIAAVLIRRYCGAALNLATVVRLRSFVLCAALPASLIMGTIGATLTAHGDFWHVWTTWAGGDFLGMIVGAPTTLLLARFRRFDRDSPAPLWERAVLILTLLAGAALVFTFHRPFLYLIFAGGLLAIIRLSPPYAALGVTLLAFVATGLTVIGFGPIAAAAGDDTGERVLLLQLFLASVLLSALVLSSVLAQRAAAQTGLRRALAAAQVARREAVEAAGAKGRFLAVMSHEMRTPLNGVIGYAQLLATRKDLPAEAQAQIEIMQTSGQILLSLINDVLDYSRLEGDRLELNCAPFSLADLAMDAGELIRPALAGRPVALEIEVSDLVGLTHLGDERRIGQILLNLLGNAAKFTDRGLIRVALERSRQQAELDWVRMTVSDTGIGIEPEKLEILFAPFQQVDSGATRSFSGAGLGLAIVRSLAGLMGGQVGVESEPGKGSTFWVELPLNRVEGAADLATTVPAPQDTHEPAKVLVVDDHPVNRQVAMLMLDAAGFDVATAENGAEAVDAIREGAFDMVFMDLHMPVMDGLTATRAIRGLPDAGRASIPVIAMTAAAMPEDIALCEAAGMDGHIAKPIEHAELVDAAVRAAARRPVSLDEGVGAG